MEARINVYVKEFKRATGKQLSLVERHWKIQTDQNLRDKLNADPYHREVEVMAKV